MPDSTYKETHTDQFAQKYLRAQYILMSLDGKHPPKGAFSWQRRAYQMDFRTEGKNFGIVLQPDDLIVDVDVRNFKPGDNPVARLVQEIGTPLKSYTVQTGGGGLHIYFKKPPEFKTRKNLKEYPGLDFLSAGAYVVGAGCIHPDNNKEYKVQFGSLAYIHKIPSALLELLRADTSPDENAEGLEEYSDDQQSINRFSEYLLSDNIPAAIEGQNGDITTFKVACRGRDFGLSPDKTHELMFKYWNPTCEPPWGEKELRTKVGNAYRYNQDIIGKRHPAVDFGKESVPDPQDVKIHWDLTEKGALRKTLANVVNFFIIKSSSLLKLFRYNEFTCDIEFTRASPWHKNNRLPKSPVWSDEDAILCKYYLTDEKHFEISVIFIHEAALILARKNAYHPVKDYLLSLEWDRRKRVDSWLNIYAGSPDTTYVKTVGKKTLVAAVARVLNPGCKFDHMLVLEGRQGTGKSSLCRILAVKWFGDINIDPKNKDTIDYMRGKWLIEASEMEVTRRSETQALKAFITRQTDRVRLAYARTSRDFPRQSIFIGTTNPEIEGGYLKDTTGNRRFWPVETLKINLTKLYTDRDQLWAEAVELYNCGETLYITDEHTVLEAEAEANKRRMSDPWAPAIDNWLASLDENGKRRDVVTTLEIWEECLGNTIRNLTRREAIRISIVMNLELGWLKGTFWHKCGKSIRSFKRPGMIDKRLRELG